LAALLLSQWWAQVVGAPRVHPHKHWYANHPPAKRSRICERRTPWA